MDEDCLAALSDMTQALEEVARCPNCPSCQSLAKVALEVAKVHMSMHESVDKQVDTGKKA